MIFCCLCLLAIIAVLNCSNLTYLYLFTAQKVDGDDFLSLSEEEIMRNFHSILFKQRKEIMKIVRNFSASPVQAAVCEDSIASANVSQLN